MLTPLVRRVRQYVIRALGVYGGCFNWAVHLVWCVDDDSDSIIILQEIRDYADSRILQMTNMTQYWAKLSQSSSNFHRNIVCVDNKLQRRAAHWRRRFNESTVCTSCLPGWSVSPTQCALEYTNQKNLDQAQCSFTEYSPRAIDICCLNEHTLTSREIACLCGWLREAGAQNFFHRLPNYSVWLRFDGCAYDELIQYNYDKRPQRL